MVQEPSKEHKPHFVNLLIGHYYQIHGFILTMVPNRTDAEDILQNTVMQMWERFEDFEPGTNFLAWSLTLARFQVLTHRKTAQRSKIRFTETTLDLLAQDNMTLSQQTNARHEALQSCMKKLPTKDRELLNLRFTSSYSVKQMAEQMKVSIKVIYRQLSKTKALLLNCIDRTLAQQGIR